MNLHRWGWAFPLAVVVLAVGLGVLAGTFDPIRIVLDQKALACDRAGGTYLEGYCLDLPQVPLDGGYRYRRCDKGGEP